MAQKIGSNPNIFASELFDGLPARYDRLGWLLSLGQDRRWRNALVERVNAREGGLILDVATGTGGVALALRGATGADVVGIDLTRRMLERAREKLDERGEKGVRLVQGRAESLPFPDDTFDSVSYTYLLRYVHDPATTLAELARVLRPGGAMSSLEFYVPPSPFWHVMWWCYTRAVLPIAGWLTGGREWFEVGRFLGPNISRHYRQYPLSWTTGAWRSAGMTNVEVRVMSVGGGVVISGIKVGDD